MGILMGISTHLSSISHKAPFSGEFTPLYEKSHFLMPRQHPKKSALRGNFLGVRPRVPLSQKFAPPTNPGN
jgi:hypothetical protein